MTTCSGNPPAYSSSLNIRNVFRAERSIMLSVLDVLSAEDASTISELCRISLKRSEKVRFTNPFLDVLSSLSKIASKLSTMVTITVLGVDLVVVTSKTMDEIKEMFKNEHQVTLAIVAVDWGYYPHMHAFYGAITRAFRDELPTTIMGTNNHSYTILNETGDTWRLLLRELNLVLYVYAILATTQFPLQNMPKIQDVTQPQLVELVDSQDKIESWTSYMDARQAMETISLVQVDKNTDESFFKCDSAIGVEWSASITTADESRKKISIEMMRVCEDTLLPEIGFVTVPTIVYEGAIPNCIVRMFKDPSKIMDVIKSGYQIVIMGKNVPLHVSRNTHNDALAVQRLGAKPIRAYFLIKNPDESVLGGGHLDADLAPLLPHVHPDWVDPPRHADWFKMRIKTNYPYECYIQNVNDDTYPRVSKIEFHDIVTTTSYSRTINYTCLHATKQYVKMVRLQSMHADICRYAHETRIVVEIPEPPWTMSALLDMD